MNYEETDGRAMWRCLSIWKHSIKKYKHTGNRTQRQTVYSFVSSLRCIGLAIAYFKNKKHGYLEFD